MKVLVTGSSGYFGNILIPYLLDNKIDVFGIDLFQSKILSIDRQYICDITNYSMLENIIGLNSFNIIIHLATEIDFAKRNQKELYINNIKMTKNLIVLGKKLNINNFIFTSSNSIFLGNMKSIIYDYDIPNPVDMYGKSKYDSELLLNINKSTFNVNIVRCPNIIDAGRVGMLSILFELLQANATLWVLNSGKIRHQCLFAQDLNSVIYKLIFEKKSNVFNLGSENVPSFLDMYLQLIESSGSKSKVRSLPNYFIIPILKLLYKLNLSPLGPYQFRMLTNDFIFDISKIKKSLNWYPTKTNTEILLLAYNHYIINKDKISFNQSANSKSINVGLLFILKFLKF